MTSASKMTAVAIRPLWLPGIVSCREAKSVSTETFLHVKVLTIDNKPQVGEFTAYVGNQKKIAEYFCHEASRFASAAFESMMVESTRPEYPRSVGWLLIRGYYAAFFAMHSLIRLHGWACTRLTRPMCDSFEEQARQLTLQGQRIEAGLYLVKAKHSDPQLTFVKLGSNQGGSHEALWSVMLDFMNAVTTLTLKDPVDTTASHKLVAAVSEFCVLIQSNGGVTWLTRLRNRVNYSHAYGAWHPYQKSTCDVTRVQSTLDQWKNDPCSVIAFPVKDELMQFSVACAFMVSLCQTTIRDLDYRSIARSPVRSSAGLLLSKI
jgi:hypothetical protein